MDNRSKRGGSDRRRVAGGQSWEVNHMKEKFKVSGQQVAGAIRAVGNDRRKVEEYLKGRSR
jgi:hypothetical protein